MQRFPRTPCPCANIASLINITYQSGTFVLTDEPILTNYKYPKSVVYIRSHDAVHSMDDMYLPLQQHTEYSQGPRNSLCCPSLPPTPHNPWSLNCSSFCFFQNVLELKSYNMQSFQIDFFHLVTGIWSPFMSPLAHVLLVLNNIPLLEVPQFMHPFTYRNTS